MKRFLGVKLNTSTNVVEKAYACGINSGIPFCIEGRREENMTADLYNSNKSLLQKITSSTCDGSDNYVICSDTIGAFANTSGYVFVQEDFDDCSVYNNGNAECI